MIDLAPGISLDWLAREHDETAPSAGAPVAETTVFITCEPACEEVRDVMLVLQSPTE